MQSAGCVITINAWNYSGIERKAGLVDRSPDWWRDAVVYQVYVKSFSDSDGDGLGDLDGLTDRLGHLAELGVDALWLNPCYPSPGRDGGYDVADYLDIDPAYGGVRALERLIDAARGYGIRVLLDIVPNHCSSSHLWFREALAEGRGGPWRDRFHFRDGLGPDGAQPPNNWRSVFGGAAWTRIEEPDGAPGQWYLHLFDSSQPDFNWSHSAVRRYFERILRHWFDRGVDGFRIDVASLLVKAPELPDYDPETEAAPPDSNQPEVHQIYRAWRALTEEYDDKRALVLVGEVWLPAAGDVVDYVRPDELHGVFYFDLLAQPWEAEAFRGSAQRGLSALAGAAERAHELGRFGALAWTLNNHDVHRAVSRYGLVAAEGSADPADPADPASETPMELRLRPRGEVDVPLGQARARAALLFMLGLPGPAFVYQGEELGLPEVLDLPDEARQDPIWLRSGGAEHGRDGCRVPLPWRADSPAFGFSRSAATVGLVETAASVAPWLPQPDWFGGFAVDVQAADESSTLAFYRAALSARRQLFATGPGEVVWLEVPTDREDVVAYSRGRVTVVTVFGSEPFRLPEQWGEVVLASTDFAAPDRELAGPGAAWAEVAAPVVTEAEADESEE
jgi:alpha-glucosidase